MLERGQADEIKGALSANLTDELRKAERAMDERDDKVYPRLEPCYSSPLTVL